MLAQQLVFEKSFISCNNEALCSIFWHLWKMKVKQNVVVFSYISNKLNVHVYNIQQEHTCNDFEQVKININGLLERTK